MPPFLGQGMCAGMRDAANLGWKLAMVLRGAASPQIFASYGMERAPHVRQIVDIAVNLGRIICTQDAQVARKRDADWLERPKRDLPPQPFPHLEQGLLCSLPEPRNLGIAGKPGLQARVREGDAAPALLDDLLGPGFALLTGAAVAPKLSAPAQRALAAVEGRIAWIPPAGAAADGETAPGVRRLDDVDGRYAAWFERSGCDTVLVRPDHAVYGAADGPDAASRLLEDLAERLGGAV
jgi:hypothetical protein